MVSRLNTTFSLHHALDMPIQCHLQYVFGANFVVNGQILEVLANDSSSRSLCPEHRSTVSRGHLRQDVQEMLCVILMAKIVDTACDI